MMTKSTLLAVTLLVTACGGQTADNSLDGKDDDFACDLRAVTKGGTFELWGESVDLTAREARLIIDMVNRMDAEALDMTEGAALFSPAVNSIAQAREAGDICTIDELLMLEGFGIGNLERLRLFASVWEMSKEAADRFGAEADGRGLSQADRLSIKDMMEVVGEFDGIKLTKGEAMLVVEQANLASFSELDGIPGFYNTVAERIVTNRATGAYEPTVEGLERLAAVDSMGPAHLTKLIQNMPNWANSMRTAYAVCGDFRDTLQGDSLDVVRTNTPRVCEDVKYDEYFMDEETIDGVTFTARQAALVLDFVNDAPADILYADGVMDDRAADAILDARYAAGLENWTVPSKSIEDDVFCDLDELAETPFVGAATLYQLRRLSVLWDIAVNKRSVEAQAELFELADREGFTVYDGVPVHFELEKQLVLSMGNFADEAWLDAISVRCTAGDEAACGFYSDAAMGIVDAREQVSFESYEDMMSATEFGAAHVGYMVNALPEWAALARQIELGGCDGMGGWFAFE